MPNWCQGTLRIRGPKKNVMKFLNECFEVNDVRFRDDQGQLMPVRSMMEGVKTEDVNVGSWVPVHLNGNGEYIYVAGTKRAFIEWDPVIGMYQNGMVVYHYDDNMTMMVILPVKQAWSFHDEDWIEISKNYEIDLHLFGWECGMEFSQELEIQNGKVMKDETCEYTDWLWESPCPFVGG